MQFSFKHCIPYDVGKVYTQNHKELKNRIQFEKNSFTFLMRFFP